MKKPKVKTRFFSFPDSIAGSAGGGAIILVGLIVLVLVLISRYVFSTVGSLRSVFVGSLLKTNYLV